MDRERNENMALVFLDLWNSSIVYCSEQNAIGVQEPSKSSKLHHRQN